jgi:hypothetical protein
MNYETSLKEEHYIRNIMKQLDELRVVWKEEFEIALSNQKESCCILFVIGLLLFLKN